MKEFIDKLIARLKEKADCHRERGFLMEQTGFSSLADKQYAKQTTFLDAIEIVNQLAEEYKGGWIPCSERLPESLEKVLVWYEYYRYGEYNCMYQTYGIGWHLDGFWSGDVSGRDARCIAWQPLPQSYGLQSEAE